MWVNKNSRHKAWETSFIQFLYSRTTSKIDITDDKMTCSDFSWELAQMNASCCVFQELFGAVQVTPLSSGYALGSSNWIIQSHYEKVSYVSGSSLLTTHPQVQLLTFLSLL